MSPTRYLTPAKISLLVLVKLHCDSEASPSPATIPVLSFILSHCIPPAASCARAQQPEGHHDTSFSIQTFKNVLQDHTSSRLPGRTLLYVFLRRMWEMNSLDALHNLFDSLGELLVRSREYPAPEEPRDRIYLSRTSPLGIFVRRARVEFTRLPFDDIMKLWSAFIRYRAPTAQWMMRLAGLAVSGVDIVATDMGLSTTDDLYEVVYGHPAKEEDEGQALSVDDLERLLDFQLDRLQRFGSRVPDELRQQLRHILEHSGVGLVQAHLVRFFDAWRAGDYTSAFDNLHRYFNYAMQARERNYYQYALLHMAILQADFGCFGEAIAAINETIATARENQDMQCLNFSLSWLNHVSKAYPKQMKGAGYMGMLGSKREGLAFLKAKARETKMYNLLGATLVSEAKLYLSTGDSIPRSLEHLYQASHLNVREHIGNHGAVMLFQSALFSRLGITHLSGAYCQLLLDCCQNGSPLDERIKATGRHAFLVAQTGRYDDALRLLESPGTSARRTLKFHQYLFLCMGQIRLKRAVHRMDWNTCDALASSLSPGPLTDPEVSYLLSEARFDYLVARGHYSEAFNSIDSLCTSLRAQGADIIQRLSTLISKADLFRKIGKPERGFSVALRAANVAFKARLMPCLWSAVGILANILNAVGECEAATRLLHAVIPQSLEHGDYFITGTLYSHIGDSYVGLAGRDIPSTSQGSRRRVANIGRAELYIDRARECFKKVENLDGECEQLMKKAIIAKLRGNDRLAEEWAQNHNRVWDQGMGRITDGDMRRRSVSTLLDHGSGG